MSHPIPAGAEVLESRVANGREVVRNLGVSRGETVLVFRLKSGAERALFVRQSGIVHVHDLPAPPADCEPNGTGDAPPITGLPYGQRTANAKDVLTAFPVGAEVVEFWEAPPSAPMQEVDGLAVAGGESFLALRLPDGTRRVFVGAPSGVHVFRINRPYGPVKSGAVGQVKVGADGKVVPPSYTPGASESFEVYDPYTAIRHERARQDKRFGGPQHDDGLTPEDFLDIVRAYCGKASDAARALGERYHGRVGLRHRLVQVAAVAVAAVESLDRRNCNKVVSPPDEQAALLDRIDLALGDLDGGEEGFIPKPQKIPERIEALTKSVRVALGDQHPGVGWTLVDRYNAAWKLRAGAEPINDRDVDTLRPLFHAAGYDVVPTLRWEDVVSWLVGTGCEVSDEAPHPLVTIRRGDDFTITVEPRANEQTLNRLANLCSLTTRELRATIGAYAEQADSEGRPVPRAASDTKPAVVVLLAEPILGARSYIARFFPEGTRLVAPGETWMTDPVDVLVVERGAADADVGNLKEIGRASCRERVLR
jgi:hypothetical protein